MGGMRSQQKRDLLGNSSPLPQGQIKREIEEVGTPKDDLVATIQEKLRQVTPLSRVTCISKVPRSLRKVNEEAYTPQLVSIGPYHHGNERLKAMEEHKIRYLSDFFGRPPRHSLSVFVQRLRELEECARQCYGNPVEGDSNMFVEMMLLDGCFIIELFFKFWESKPEVVTSDPLFHIASTMIAIRVDMLLLENQLPLFILEQILLLYTGTDQIYEAPSFLEFVVHFFNFKILLNIAQDFSLVHVKKSELKHFLDLLRECCLPSNPNALVECNEDEDCKFIPSATELHKTGVKFKKAKRSYSMNLKFSANGVFELPTLIVQDTSEVLFRNLVAFEQCFKVGREHYISHYLALLDFLINSPNDVAILRRHGIIENFLGDNESVSLLFNKIFQGVHIYANTFYFNQLSKDVNNYYKTPWHSFKAMLFREYFYSPWSIASSIAVIIVVVCTIIQTVLTAIFAG
ncbi:hypothetical protein AQUCO_02800007v1 [Aquilegia coerulea]|uniref:Uncharacterized protein n=1 Tax=Aquilegia coerulea TaxID=218851 RepID=A0A2G5D3G8_AQUCA|nr:hypothetical protein AQUCO_02800007v1 [Aquilegia coerulea]